MTFGHDTDRLVGRQHRATESLDRGEHRRRRCIGLEPDDRHGPGCSTNQIGRTHHDIVRRWRRGGRRRGNHLAAGRVVVEVHCTCRTRSGEVRTRRAPPRPHRGESQPANRSTWSPERTSAAGRSVDGRTDRAEPRHTVGHDEEREAVERGLRGSVHRARRARDRASRSPFLDVRSTARTCAAIMHAVVSPWVSTKRRPASPTAPTTSRFGPPPGKPNTTSAP